MKRKTLLVFFLSLFSFPLFIANVQAGQSSFRLLRNNFRENSYLDGNSQGRNWLFWKNPNFQDLLNSQIGLSQWANLPLAGNDESLQWISAQITAALSQLQQQEGVDLPADIDQKLNNFFSVVRTYLTESERQVAIPLPNFLKEPNYDMNWNYDPKTQIMKFIANRILSSEHGLVTIDLDGSFNLKEGPWNLGFVVVNAVSNRDRSGQRRAYFQKAYSKIASSKIASSTSSQDTSKDPQTDDASAWQIAHSSKFTLRGQVSNTGLVSLYLNPCHIVDMSLANYAYSTKTGIEVSQDGELRAGNLYMDVIDKRVSGADDKVVFQWDFPLW